VKTATDSILCYLETFISATFYLFYLFSTSIVNFSFNMKSPFYILAVLLPLATDLALATPVADPNSDSLEERHRGNDKGYKDHHEYEDHHGNGDENVCEVKYPYPYYKYPCNSSPTNGTSTLGATFTSFCKYQ
jgi:hypothetical protein